MTLIVEKSNFITLPKDTTPLLLVGDVINRLKNIPDKSINVIVTSPPYWGQRDYGTEGQIGNEQTPYEYVNKMLEVADELKRVLTDDGAFFLNIGDKYVGKKLHKALLENNGTSDLEKAARFFVLNRITFSGLAESRGYSDSAFNHRFTISSIDRLKKASKLLQETKITNEDYNKVLSKEGEEVFIFLDPPYYTTTKSKLYGKKGSLHEGFDHTQFAENMKKCKHGWLITYDDCPEVRELFKFANIYVWQLQYGMNNYKQKNAKKGKELFISNYEVPSLIKSKVN